MSRKGGMEGIALGLLSVLICQYVRLRRKKLKYQDAYWAERRGRARVEKEMKKIANIRLSKDEGFFVQPVGYISSCYRQCVGTPRQGMLVPHSRSSITLAKNVSPEALDGLEEFSHVWITFQFHLNSNTLKEANAFSKRATFQAKINPPMLKGIKLGVLATRSPHRPNPIGVTLAQIRGIDKKSRTLLLHACDLVDGTPVLDIKPYVPAYDTVPQYRVPNWIKETVSSRNEVVVNQHCVDAVRSMQNQLVQFKNDPEEYILALVETLQAEVRSKFQTRKQMEFSSKGRLVEVLFDETLVKYDWVEERKFEITEIILASQDKARIETLKKLISESDEEEQNNDSCLEALPVIQEEEANAPEN